MISSCCLPEIELVLPPGWCKKTARATIFSNIRVSLIKKPHGGLVNAFDYYYSAAINKTVSP